MGQKYRSWKKYAAINYNPWGDDYDVYHRAEINGCTYIYLKSKHRRAPCPVCGTESEHLHSTYERTIQDVPIEAKTTYLNVNAYKFYCDNPDCKVRVFKEELPFAHGQQVRTDALNLLILSIAIITGNKTAEDAFARIGIKVSDSTIQRICKRAQRLDNPNLKRIGIDDVSIRKGNRYLTAIYDMETHALEDLLEGRDGKALKEWLESHPNIEVVARDRASAFAKVLDEAMPECTQIADRFHLIKNMMDNLRELNKTNMPEKVFARDGKVLEKEPAKIPVEDVLDTSSLSYDNTPPVDANGQEISFNTVGINPFTKEARASRIQQQKKTRSIIKLPLQYVRSRGRTSI